MNKKEVFVFLLNIPSLYHLCPPPPPYAFLHNHLPSSIWLHASVPGVLTA